MARDRAEAAVIVFRDSFQAGNLESFRKEPKLVAVEFGKRPCRLDGLVQVLPAHLNLGDT